MKKILLLLSAIVASQLLWAQAAYRSKVTSGNWSDTATWQRSTNGGASWSPLSSTSQIPSLNDTVFIQSGHTVSLTQTQSCYDLNLGSTSGTRINLSTFALNLYGRLRCVGSTLNTWPVTYTTSLPSTVTWINSYSGGYINVVGITRNLTNAGEWGNNPPGWIMRVNLNSGQTVTTNTGLKLGRLEVNTGTLYTAGTATGGYDIRPDSGAALTGDIIVNAGGAISLGYTAARTSSAGAQFDSLVINGVFELRATVGTPALNAVNLVVNAGGQLKQSSSVPYTYSLTNINYGTSSSLVYSGTTAQTVGGEWPATLVLKKLVVNNTGGLTIPTTRTITDSLVMTAGNVTIPVTDSLILGTSATGVLVRTNGTILGKLNRFVSSSTTGNVLFPVGSATYYRPVIANFVNAPMFAGNITIMHVDAGTGGSSITGFSDGSYTVNRRSNSYWQGYYNNSLTALNILLSADMAGQIGISNASETRLIGSLDNGTTFGNIGGTHSNGSGTVAYRAGFQVGSGPANFRLYFGGNATTNPLPVAMYNFNATLEKAVAVLTWYTAVELNNNHFEVEKSINGTDFTVIEPFIKGAVNSSSINKYRYVDKDLNAPVLYYRIKQVDLDGNINYSGIVSLETTEEADIMFSPNPVRDLISIRFTSPAPATIEVMDISGKIYYSGEHTSKEVGIQAESFPNGVLLVRIQQNGMIITKRILKK